MRKGDKWDEIRGRVISVMAASWKAVSHIYIPCWELQNGDISSHIEFHRYKNSINTVLWNLQHSESQHHNLSFNILLLVLTVLLSSLSVVESIDTRETSVLM